MAVNLKNKPAKGGKKKMATAKAAKTAVKAAAKAKPKAAAKKKAAASKKAFMETETVVTAEVAGTQEGSGTIMDAETEKVEFEAVVEAAGEPGAEIEFGLQCIIPTGEYTNVRVSVGAKVKCEADTKVMDATFNVVKGWVDNKISGVVAEIQGAA